MSNAIPLPQIVRISRLLEIAPSVRSQPLVGLAHRNLTSASDEELSTHVLQLFEACWVERLSPSEALSLVWGSNVGSECGFRKLTPTELWEHYGWPTYEARQKSEPVADESESTPMPEWWGSRFEAWAAQAAPDLPASFRRAIGWSVLSALLGEHVATPVGQARLTVGLVGANVRARDDACQLGGMLALPVELLALAALSAEAERLTATEADDVIASEALRERQGPPDHSSDPVFALLTSEALDGLERAQAALGGPLVVKSSEDALDAVTTFRTDLAARLRTLRPDTLDERLSGSALLVRRMAALVAVADGATLVSGVHQAIAIDAASESVRTLVRYLETGLWLARQV